VVPQIFPALRDRKFPVSGQSAAAANSRHATGKAFRLAVVGERNAVNAQSSIAAFTRRSTSASASFCSIAFRPSGATILCDGF